jgi:hypothetical protein
MYKEAGFFARMGPGFLSALMHPHLARTLNSASLRFPGVVWIVVPHPAHRTGWPRNCSGTDSVTLHLGHVIFKDRMNQALL